MATINESIDLQALPKSARTELLDFYEFLRSKYGSITVNHSSESAAANSLCNRAAARAIQLPDGYCFDRDEIHER